MTKRPLTVVQLVTTMSSGGAQRTVIETARHATDELRVVVWAGPDLLDEGDLWAVASDAGVPVVVVPTLHRSVRPWSDLRTIVGLVRALKAERPDVIHTHSSKAGVVGRVAGAIAGVPVVHTVHGWSFAAFGSGWARTPVVWLERVLARLTHTLVVVTPVDRREGEAHRIRPRHGYAVVRSGIDLGVARDGVEFRSARRRSLGLADDSVVVGTVARLSPQKRLGTFLDALARLASDDRWVAVIVGDGPQRHELEARAGVLGLADRVVFTGERSDAASLVAILDVFVSTSAWEGLPRAVVEALAAGVPVVATPVGGVPEVVVEGETGHLVPVGDAAAVADAVGRLIGDGGLRERFSIAASASVDAFSDQAMRDAVADVWRSAAACRSTA